MNIKQENKRKQILSAATDLLMELGYENTSLKAICEKAQCSKSAIYQYFGNKQGLLATLTEDTAQELAQSLYSFQMQHLCVETTLIRYSELALKCILNDKHIAVVRATIASLSKHPELGPTYYQVGALTGQAALTKYFSAQHKAGTLLITDPKWAAHEFQGLLFWEKLMAQVVGAKKAPGPKAIKQHAKQVVESFLLRYQTK